MPGPATTATTLDAPAVAGRRRDVASYPAAGLAAALGASAWLVLAAAERPSVLSPPTLRGAHRWLLGPLSGALPHLTTSVVALRADFTIALVVMFAAWVAAWIAA